MAYYADRHVGAKPRTATEIEPQLAEAIANLVVTRAHDGWLGLEYSEQWPDGRGPVGTNIEALKAGITAHAIYNPFIGHEQPPTILEILDLIEFAYSKIAEPRRGSFHEFFGHYHLGFDRAAGRTTFRQEINQIFSRNGIAYELMENGQVDRIAPEILRELLTTAVFQTGDDISDELLERARAKFLSSEPAVRKESLEALWDAWERLKTLEPGRDKRETTSRLLDKASREPNFRTRVLETDARLLTDIGNEFMIRHPYVSFSKPCALARAGYRSISLLKAFAPLFRSYALAIPRNSAFFEYSSHSRISARTASSSRTSVLTPIVTS